MGGAFLQAHRPSTAPAIQSLPRRRRGVSAQALSRPGPRPSRSMVRPSRASRLSPGPTLCGPSRPSSQTGPTSCGPSRPLRSTQEKTRCASRYRHKSAAGPSRSQGLGLPRTRQQPPRALGAMNGMDPVPSSISSRGAGAGPARGTGLPAPSRPSWQLPWPSFFVSLSAALLLGVGCRGLLSAPMRSTHRPRSRFQDQPR